MPGKSLPGKVGRRPESVFGASEAEMPAFQPWEVHGAAVAILQSVSPGGHPFFNRQVKKLKSLYSIRLGGVTAFFCLGSLGEGDGGLWVVTRHLSLQCLLSLKCHCCLGLLPPLLLATSSRHPVITVPPFLSQIN